MRLTRPTVLVRYSHSFSREIAQILADGRHTSAVVWSSPDGRTVVTHTGSTYAAGLWLKNNCPRTNPQIAAAFYHLTVPAAVSYTSFKVTTSGRSRGRAARAWVCS